MLTTLAAVISYFFCKHDEAESLKARTIISMIQDAIVKGSQGMLVLPTRVIHPRIGTC